MELEGSSYTYRIGDKVGTTKTYNLYRCTQLETRRDALLMIALNTKSNGVLDRLAYLLRELKKQSDQLEEAFNAVKERPEQRLNYHFGFPELLESFRAPESQGRRRVNVIAFACADRIGEMVPLSNIVKKDGQRVDLQSSVWILGKFLKVLAFAHDQGVEVGRLSMSNLLIQPSEHLVTIFDWSSAQLHSTGEVPRDSRRDEISALARSVIGALGGNAARRHIPRDEKDADTYDRYTRFLFQLVGGRWADAHAAHSDFYEMVDGLWERGFHPFATLPLNSED